MTQLGRSRRTASRSAAGVRAVATATPRSRPVPATRLVKIRSSHRWTAVTSDGLRAALAGADAEAVLQRQDKNLAVADPPLRPGPAGLYDGVHGRFDEVLVDG